MNYCIALQGIFPARSDASPYLSQIELFWVQLCAVGAGPSVTGSLMAISQNTALFSLLGTNFGGNGTSTFALPNLQGRVALGMGPGQPASVRLPLGRQPAPKTNTVSQ